MDRHGAVSVLWCFAGGRRGALVHRRVGSASRDLPGTRLLGSCARRSRGRKTLRGRGFSPSPASVRVDPMHSVVASLPARDHLTRRERERFLRGDACSALWSSAPRVPTLRVVPHECVHAWKSHSKSIRPLSAVVAREHQRRRFRNRSASCVRAPFDARPLWTRESRSATLHPGLGGARPRTKHPDFVSARPRSQPVRLPESPGPAPNRL